jgi:hypothetical protein
MSHEPVLFDSTMLETANDAFLFCKEHLEKSEPRAAEALEGLAPINVPVLGRLALRALRDLEPRVKGADLEYVCIAINAMERALAAPALGAVA